MKKVLTLLFVVASFIAPFAQSSTWNVDPSHSKVGFSVEHLVISEVDGNFKAYEGQMTTSKADLTDASISFSVDVSSVDTDNERRDGHLQAEEFFYAEKHPKMTFKSTSFEKLSAKKYKLTGDLTLRGVTKSVVFDVTYGGHMADDGYGNEKMGFKATSAINRIEYGVAWNAETKQGGWTVGEEVDITLKLEVVKQK